ncbi:hypothetical protein PSTT_00034 [Puccinia striiformis]|uniref:Uncharacterized protein n=1 Tax=Puccinia striiformis TaxID=27350 RepID=A0A2S4W7X2_9BASI|nr:hypothetical protein PSTT_00034 [Puccinia striiformis]
MHATQLPEFDVHRHLKRSDHKNAARFNWLFWKTKHVTWQISYKQGAVERTPVTLFDDSQCSANFQVELKSCTIYQDPKFPKTSTYETEKHTSQPSPILAEGQTSKATLNGPIVHPECLST